MLQNSQMEDVDRGELENHYRKGYKSILKKDRMTNNTWNLNEKGQNLSQQRI
jgi:hypothetical protein